MPSDASTSPHTAQHTSMEASCICTMLVAISTASRHCECFEPKRPSHTHVLKSPMLSPGSSARPTAIYFDVANPLQKSEGQGVVDAIQRNPADLWPWLPSLGWSLGVGGEHFPAPCDRFSQPRPPEAMSCAQPLHIKITFPDLF